MPNLNVSPQQENLCPLWPNSSLQAMEERYILMRAFGAEALSLNPSLSLTVT